MSFKGGAKDGVDRAKVFIFGQFGEELKELDSERLKAVVQASANYHLFQASMSEIDGLLEKVLALEEGKELPDKLLDEVSQHNIKANLFRELHRYMTEGDDNLATGSLLLGETEKLAKWMKSDKELDDGLDDLEEEKE